jgi:hypothetical protein
MEGTGVDQRRYRGDRSRLEAPRGEQRRCRRAGRTVGKAGGGQEAREGEGETGECPQSRHRGC